MLNLLASCLVTIILYFIYGSIFFNKSVSNSLNFSKNIINGSIIISFISLLLNFFVPLTKEVNSLLYLIILIYFFKLRFFEIKKYFIFFILITTLTYILIFASHTYRPDAGLYHLPFINILNEEKIIFGLTNLHFRFGHISIIQYLSAINYNFINNVNGITIPSAVIASAVIINFLIKLKNHIQNKNYNFHFYYLMGVVIYIFFKMSRYAEYGNDAPAHFITFYFFSEFLKMNLKKLNIDEILNITLIGLFIVLNKITLIFVLIIPCVLILKNKSLLIFRKSKFYFIIFFGILWITKNVIISGCLIYPVKLTCYEDLSWSDIKTVEKISLENEAFSKNWPNYEKRNEITQFEYVKKFKWLKNWSKKLFDEQKEKSFAYFLILIFISLILLKKSIKNNENYEKKFLFLFTILVSTMFWLIKIPDYRYAYSIIISLITYPFALFFSNRNFVNNPKKLFSSILIIFFSVFIIKNFIRIFNTNIYNDFPNPRIYSHEEDNKKLKYSKKKINNKTIYNQKNGYCMYGKNLCTPYEIIINIETRYSYLFFLKKI